MVVLRPTHKLRSALPLSPNDSGDSDTALGDWYVNRIVVHRRPLLLLTSSKGLFPLLTPARDVRSLPERLPVLVGGALRRLSVPDVLIAPEVAAMSPVVTAPTRDRSVLGIMVDAAFSLPHYLPEGPWDDTTMAVAEYRLACTPWHAAKRATEVVVPIKVAPQLLAEHWAS